METTTRERRYYNQVDQHCRASSPGPGEKRRDWPTTKLTCRACGNPVCENCSLLVTYPKGSLARRSRNCVGNEIEDGEKLTWKHIYMLSGYSEDSFPQFWNDRINGR
jgi:hypothetical protein